MPEQDRLARLHETVIRTAAEGICVCHPCDAYPFVRFSVWNGCMTALTGYSMDEINRLGWYQTLYPDPQVRERAKQRMERMRVGDDLRDEEWTIARRDGQPRTLSMSTSRVDVDDGPAVVCLLTDVTGRREAAAALRASEEHFRLLAEHSRDVVALLDLEGRYLYVSPSSERFSGYPAAAHLGRSCYEFIHPDDRERVRAGPHADAAQGRDSLTEWRLLCRDGTTKWMETVAEVLLDAKGRPWRTLCVTRDVSERRRQDEQRRQAEGRLQEAQRRESLGVLAGGAAHDFNNMLQVVQACADQARLALPAGSPALDDLDRADAALQRAGDLCAHLLAYAGRTAVVAGPVDLNDLCAEMARLLRASVSRKVSLVVEPGAVPCVLGDATQLRQVAMNLIANAAQAIEGEGRVVVRTLPLGPGTVRLEVADTGAGMDEATKARIFEPFFTTKPAGRGLGLAAVAGIVRTHGGTLAVQSAPGRGTVFRIDLPATGEAPPLPAPARKALPFAGRKALVADDEPSVRMLVRCALQEMGFEVAEAADGQEALSRFAESGAGLSVVLLDLTMPVMSGQEAFKAIRLSGSAVPVVLMSGYSDAGLDGASAAGGPTAFLQKPFRLEGLERIVAGLLAG